MRTFETPLNAFDFVHYTREATSRCQNPAEVSLGLTTGSVDIHLPFYLNRANLSSFFGSAAGGGGDCQRDQQDLSCTLSLHAHPDMELRLNPTVTTPTIQYGCFDDILSFLILNVLTKHFIAVSITALTSAFCWHGLLQGKWILLCVGM